jgi:ABC-type nitrate/sulfonate/bicarbonate transport system substrate-binding protein
MFSYQGLVDGGFRSIDDLGETMQPTISEGLAASDDLISNRPSVLQRFLAATSQALIYMDGHEKWTVDFLKKYFNGDDERVIRLVYTEFIKKIPPDGVMERAWMEDSLQLGSVGGVTVLSPDQVFSTAFTPIKDGG